MTLNEQQWTLIRLHKYLWMSTSLRIKKEQLKTIVI